MGERRRARRLRTARAGLRSLGGVPRARPHRRSTRRLRPRLGPVPHRGPRAAVDPAVPRRAWRVRLPLARQALRAQPPRHRRAADLARGSRRGGFWLRRSRASCAATWRGGSASSASSGLALAPGVLQWNAMVSTESLSMSALCAVIAFGFRLVLRPAHAEVAWFITALAFFAFTRDTNALVVGGLALIAIGCAFRRSVRVPALVVGAAGLALAVSASALANAADPPRWYWPIAETTAVRLLDDPVATRYLVDHGFPWSSSMRTLPGRYVYLYEPVRTGTSFAAFRYWVRRRPPHLRPLPAEPPGLDAAQAVRRPRHPLRLRHHRGVRRGRTAIDRVGRIPRSERSADRVRPASQRRGRWRPGLDWRLPRSGGACARRLPVWSASRPRSRSWATTRRGTATRWRCIAMRFLPRSSCGSPYGSQLRSWSMRSSAGPTASDVRVPEDADLDQQQHQRAPRDEPAGAVADAGAEGGEGPR